MRGLPPNNSFFHIQLHLTILTHNLCNHEHLSEVSLLHSITPSENGVFLAFCFTFFTAKDMYFFYFVERDYVGDIRQDWNTHGVRSDFLMDLATGVANGQGRHPIFSFGVIADVQYADIPDGHSFLGVRRYYRHSILVLQRAVKSWNGRKNLNFVINFGDIVDGKCPKDQSLDAVKKVVGEFENFHGPVYHMIGNHCLYNLPRDKLLPLLKIPNHGGGHAHAYYDFSPTPGYRFVVLDGYDISAIGWPIDHPNTLEAMKVLNEKNPNSNKNSPEGLEGVDRRSVMFNGAVGKEQMEWLNSVLQDATNMEQKVIVCCHLPLDPGATSKTTLLWNYDQVMDVIHRYDCVKVCLSGHNHEGGYSIDSHGVHHRVLDAALECPPGTDAFGYIDVYDNMLSLVGTDRLENTDFSFDS